MRVAPDYSRETLEARGQWSFAFNILRGNYFPLKLCIPLKFRQMEMWNEDVFKAALVEEFSKQNRSRGKEFGGEEQGTAYLKCALGAWTVGETLLERCLYRNKTVQNTLHNERNLSLVGAFRMHK